MGNKTGKFDVTKESENVKTENDVQEPIVAAEKVEQTESAPVTEPKENGETEAKEEIVPVEAETTEEVVANDSEHKVEVTETAETKKKGLMGWLKKISFRKEKKPAKVNETENKEEEKANETEEKKEEEHIEEKPHVEEVEKVEEVKTEEKPHEEEQKIEEAPKNEE